MKYPILEMHLERLKENADEIVQLGEKYGVGIMGVTKVTCAHPDVAKTLLKSGVTGLADSRIRNIKKMRDFGIDTYYTLIRIPMLTELKEVVKYADCSLNSELKIIKAINTEAKKQEKVHEIILMVDLGDLREGVWPEDVLDVVGQIVEMEHVSLKGLGTNLTCWGGVLPTKDNLAKLPELKSEIEEKYDIELDLISGGNSSSLPLLKDGDMPEGINNLRVGEVIMLGNDTVSHNPFPETRQDTFVLKAEIVELKKKPSHPIGKIGLDAFGKKPVFEDKGMRTRAILGIGKQDLATDSLKALDPGIQVVGGSSDHVIIDITDSEKDYEIGSVVSFTVGYETLLKTTTSPYVKKVAIK